MTPESSKPPTTLEVGKVCGDTRPTCLGSVRTDYGETLAKGYIHFDLHLDLGPSLRESILAGVSSQDHTGNFNRHTFGYTAAPPEPKSAKLVEIIYAGRAGLNVGEQRQSHERRDTNDSNVPKYPREHLYPGISGSLLKFDCKFALFSALEPKVRLDMP
ncbi:hypothetical protein QQS21_001919 [Conoideocrella luteorostrata]|uniref:Uncharacterized protein n=1 Tax=Conoideocrella luteorostrata TaxID=1105319 RepID=A0AAJ0CW75_9HYPO|nr:hypothetical protein QQS21_001919 [Conoideocrella luteorostrata]